ncbi:hypothetical protein KC19_5G143600 [Ceratodon purpureus]|uniref:Uncharacterized protein n=1 Tax=Ceratodon purpureus TaxID=3225 RepID=A0A8T0I1F4_CERPU|nr:hypothetical protein KC19_5G143600 [Ceratodon purpureus]
MSGSIEKARGGGEVMGSSGAGGVDAGPVGEKGGGSMNVESSEVHGERLMNGVKEEARALKREAVSADGENSSRSNQGSMRASSRGDEGGSQGAKRGSRRKGEPEGVTGGLETPHRPRLDRSAKRGDSGTKPVGDETNLNEGVVESSMFKQTKFENGAAITQYGLTDDDDKAKAFDALAAVMALYGTPKEVVGRVADFPGEIGVGSKQLCRVCKKPETAKNTIVCDKCQSCFHLACVKLKAKQAVEIENEHWQCDFCGPEVGSPHWPLGRITPQHDRKLADPKVVEPVPHVNAVERRVVTVPETDAAVTSKGGDHGGLSNLQNVSTPSTIDQEVGSFPKESIMSVKRGRGRPKRDSSAFKEKTTTNAAVDLAAPDRVISEEQPPLILGYNVSAPQPSSLTPAPVPAPVPAHIQAMPSQIPVLGVTDTLTTTDDKGILGDGGGSQQQLLEDLRTFIEGMNLKLEKGWEVIIKHRPSNPLVTDKIYISPEGHKFRSRLQVARFLENPKSRTNVQSAAQRLENSIQRADLSLEGLETSREMPLNLNLVEPQEEREKRIEKEIPIVKESRSLPPTGDLLTRRLPVELVGDALEVWEFVCRFSDVLDLKSPLTYEELETGLVNLGPSASEDTILNVDAPHSSNPSSGENSEKVFAEVVGVSPHKPTGLSRDSCVEETGVTLESASNPVVQGEDSKAADPVFNEIDTAANCLKEVMSVTVETGGLPQSTTVQKNTDLIPGPLEPPGEKVSVLERTVASPDGTLNESFVMIGRTHIPLLRLVLSDLQFRINGSSNVSKSEEPKKKGRKPLHESPQETQVDVPEFSSDLPMNEVTWPELARRYMITLIEAEKYGDLTELTLDERKWLLRCLQGDGGVPCGALYTNLGAESDALVLAEAEKELAVREPKDGEVKEGEDEQTDKLPEWVEALKPVAKMATNVGSRIRIKVKEALELGPPQWAKEQLEWSISKDVFKGNASGPTKKAVVEVLNHYEISPPCESPIDNTKARTLPSVDQLMRRCRVVLRTLAEADNLSTFSILIGGPEGHGSRRLRGMVPRPLDFRTIDARLAAGAYGGSVDAFAEDVRQIWRNVELLHKSGDVLELATTLSRLFEDLLQKQVINFMNGDSEVKVKELKVDVANVVEEGTEPTNTPLTRSHLVTAEKPEDKLQTAPWQDESTCKVCGVDEDYGSIMLCDTCDAEYHTYCLNPPLTTVPEGNWFCPQCVALDKGFPDRPSGKDGEVVEPEALEGKDKQSPAGRKTLIKKELKEVKGESPSQCLLKQIESKEYWQLGLSERVHLLKFLCDEALKTTQVRAHLEKSVDLAFDLQQQLSNLQLQRQGVLKTRSHAAKVAQASSVETWSSRLRHHPSSALGAEDIGVSMPRVLYFDAVGKEDKYSAERINTTNGASDSVKEGSNNLVILLNKTVSQASAPADRDTPLAVFDSADMLKKRRIDDVSANDNELATQVERAEASTPERIVTRNSKRTKFEEHGEGGDPQVEDTKVSATSKQAQDPGLLFESELHDKQTVSKSKTDGVIDPEIQMKELVGSASSVAGDKNISVDEAGESGSRVALRSSHLTSEHPDSSGASGMLGVAGAGLPPRTPKRKLETTSSSETLKRLRTDSTVNGEGIVDGKSPSKLLKDNLVDESQSVVGTAHGIPALGEVIDDPHRDEAVSDPKRQGPLQSTQSTPIVDASAISKLDTEIVELELKLYNTTLRRDHLGIDDVGRQYWALSGRSCLPLLVVSEFDGRGRPEFNGADETFFSYVEHSGRESSEGEILQSDPTLDKSNETKTRWWAYNNEASIESLMAWLNPRVKVERELKSSICRWRESASLIESNQEKVNTSCLGNGTDGSLKKEHDTVKAAPKRFPTLKATSILQMRYGSYSFSDRITNKKLAMPMEGRVIRCSCLEPLWKFKWHCSACHETYESLAELESHKNICPEGLVTQSSGKKKQKGSGKTKNSLTPEKAKKTATSEKGKKIVSAEKGKKAATSEKGKRNIKAATPKKDGIKRSLENGDNIVRTCEENSWMSDDFTEPSTLNRPATRGKRQADSHPDDGQDVNGDLPVSEEPVDDAFFLSDFQDDVHNPDMDNAGQEDFRYRSFQSLLQDDEWEANVRPERSELKRKKHGSGKKSPKQPPTQGTSEMALADFDYASLPMTFSTSDSTRDRILQIGCIADRGPTFAPALHFAPAFDPSLMIQPCYTDPNESPTDAGEFPGSSPLPSSQNGSPIGELNTKDFVEGGLDAVSWYDPQTSGDMKPDGIFVPDTLDTEPVVQPGSGVTTWDLAELVGLPKTEFDPISAPLVDGGELDQQLSDETIHFCALNTDGENKPSCTPNGEEASLSVDERAPESVDLVPEALPVQDMEVPLEIVLTGVKTVQDMSLKKQAKKFVAPEPSLRTLVGEQYGVLIGLKMRVLDMEAAMGVEALIPSKSAPPRRRAWRSLVKSAKCIYEMTKTVILLEQMVRPDCLKRTWCYWSSLSSAARSATLSTLALRIFSLDSAITYKKDKVVADESQRPSTLRKPKKKVQVQVPLTPKAKKANRAG